jgi:hypothetical protein
MKSLIFSSFFLVVFSLFGQDLTGPQLLDKAIDYHDPNGNWETFSGMLKVTMETPNNSNRISQITIDLPKEYFHLVASKDSTQTTYTLNKKNCTTTITDSISHPNQRRTPCETARLYKNYYTYLYGLPMKLKDPGTIISKEVLKKKFKSKDYLVVKATYDEAVGSDVWYFYFDPETFAMEVYQFFKGNPDGSGKDTGEYILLSEEVNINEIKMPKNRAWYYNKDDKYLGTDILK